MSFYFQVSLLSLFCHSLEINLKIKERCEVICFPSESKRMILFSLLRLSSHMQNLNFYRTRSSFIYLVRNNNRAECKVMYYKKQHTMFVSLEKIQKCCMQMFCLTYLSVLGEGLKKRLKSIVNILISCKTIHSFPFLSLIDL